MNAPTPLQKAVDLVGGQAALAEKIGKKQPHVWNWLNRGNKRAPGEFCIAIEQATDGRVTRYELRPDVFGTGPHEKDKAG